MKEKKKLKDWIAEHQRTLTIIADGCITVGVFGLGVALGKVVQSSYDCNCMGWALMDMENRGFVKFFDPATNAVLGFDKAATLWIKSKDQ